MMNFHQLIENIRATHDVFFSASTQTINVYMTLRNLLIGKFIVDFEQGGEDRASYGEAVVDSLADKLNEKGFSARNLKLFRQFYLCYPQFSVVLPRFLTNDRIMQTASAQLKTANTKLPEIMQTLSAQFVANEHETIVQPDKLMSCLSFSHFTELIKIDDPLKRAFYEIETIRNTWSVREMRRQIDRILYERSGLSKDREGLIRHVNKTITPSSPEEIIRDPYIFEFLQLPAKHLVKETDLEKAMLDGIEDFLMELGNGFCFEARQKMILIDGEYFFVDLVFYHRILHCHVLIELKVDKFKHEHISQLNSYVNYYDDIEKSPGDRKPVGILLCTGVNKALVKYATGGMNTKLFVREYKVNLPD
ncbi:MAG: DUF1016 family protein, partial [Bacteroidetes bacterium]|nr:DUF1016 family protein [Bacteroidota bacterium]